MNQKYLWHAVNAGNLEAVRTLYNANPSTLLSIDFGGNTALHSAMRKAVHYKNINTRLQIVHYLLDVGHPICVKNSEGKTPLDYDLTELRRIIGPWLRSKLPRRRLNDLDLRLLSSKFDHSDHPTQEDKELIVVIKRIHVEQTKEQQLSTEEALKLNDEEQYQFAQKLLAITTEDIFGRTMQLLDNEIMLLCKKRLAVDTINAIFQKCLAPSLLVDLSVFNLAAQSKPYWQLWQPSMANKFSVACREILSLSRLLNQFIEEHKLKSDYEIICNLLVTLKDFYRQFCDTVNRILQEQDRNKLERQVKEFLSLPYAFNSLDLQSRLLQYEAATYLESNQRDNETGSHTLRNYGQIHFKHHPFDPDNPYGKRCYPSIEFMVASLHSVIAEQAYGIAPTEIVRMQQQSKKSKIFIASNTVAGINLKDLIMGCHDYLNHCDEYSCGAMIVTSFLSTPIDGKFDNYMVQFIPIKNSQGVVISFTVRIIGIDNDLSFGDPTLRDTGDPSQSLRTEIICVFFLLPLMEKKISPTFRKQLLARPAALLILEWIKALAKKDQYYQNLLTAKILTQAEWNSLFLPILFTQGRLSFIYLQLLEIQNYLRAKPEATYDQLFVHLYPRLGSYYRHFRNKFKDHPTPIVAAYNAIKDDDRLKEVTTCRQQDSEEISLRTPFMTTKNREDFLQKRTQPLVEAIEQFLHVLDFSVLEQHDYLLSQLVISQVKEIQSIRNLTLRNCAALEGYLLKNLLLSLPALERLTLINCPNITAKDISLGALSYPNRDARPLVLVIENCQQIGIKDYAYLLLQKHLDLNLVSKKTTGSFFKLSLKSSPLPDILDGDLILSRAQVKLLINLYLLGLYKPMPREDALRYFSVLLLLLSKMSASRTIQQLSQFFISSRKPQTPIEKYRLPDILATSSP